MKHSAWRHADSAEERRKERKRIALTHVSSSRQNDCHGKCGKTRYQCLKVAGVNMYEDQRLLTKLQCRYDSWLQGKQEYTHGMSNWFHSNLFNQD